MNTSSVKKSKQTRVYKPKTSKVTAFRSTISFPTKIKDKFQYFRTQQVFNISKITGRPPQSVNEPVLEEARGDEKPDCGRERQNPTDPNRVQFAEKEYENGTEERTQNRVIFLLIDFAELLSITPDVFLETGRRLTFATRLSTTLT